jgi:hypothetical protein
MSRARGNSSGGQDGFRQLVAADIVNWAKVIKSAGFKPG